MLGLAGGSEDKGTVQGLVTGGEGLSERPGAGREVMCPFYFIYLFLLWFL